jgi:hypothetical protein
MREAQKRRGRVKNRSGMVSFCIFEAYFPAHPREKPLTRKSINASLDWGFI